METNNKLTTLQEAFARLKKAGVVCTQKDFADLIGVHKSTMSAAMNGSEAALTEKLMARTAQAVRQLQPEVKKAVDEIQKSVDFEDLIRYQRDLIDKLVVTVQRQSDMIARLINEKQPKP